MNKLFLTLALISSLAQADCVDQNTENTEVETTTISTDVPKHLKGARITITLADGRTSTVPAELFKVVPRKQQRVITKVKSSTVRTCTNEAPELKNRISLLGGRGAKEGLDSRTNGSTVEVESKVGTIFGVQYQRVLPVKVFGKPLNVGGQVQTGKSALGSVGIDF